MDNNLNLFDQYKLQLVEGRFVGDVATFTVETKFIPLKAIGVSKASLNSTHNGSYLRLRDLSQILEESKTIDITWLNLMFFDLSDFTMSPGVYTVEFSSARYTPRSDFYLVLIYLQEL